MDDSTEKRGRKSLTGEKEGDSPKFYMRATREDQERWKDAAKIKDEPLSVWARRVLNNAARRLINRSGE